MNQMRLVSRTEVESHRRALSRGNMAVYREREGLGVSSEIYREKLRLTLSPQNNLKGSTISEMSF